MTENNPDTNDSLQEKIQEFFKDKPEITKKITDLAYKTPIQSMCEDAEYHIRKMEDLASNITPKYNYQEFNIEKVENSFVGNTTNSVMNNNQDKKDEKKEKPESWFENLIEKHKHKKDILLWCAGIIITGIFTYLTIRYSGVNKP